MMSLGIRHKLIIAFTSIALLVTLVAFVVMLLSFRSGFLQYLNDVRFNSLEQLSEVVATEITTESQWRLLTSHPRRWHRFVRQNSGAHIKPHSPFKSQHFNHQALDQTTLPPFRERYFLLDHQKNIIFGRPNTLNTLLLSPVMIDRDIVGYIGLVKLTSLDNTVSNSADNVFVAKQTRYFMGIAIAACGIAIIVAFFVSGWMVAPIKRLVKAMTQLMHQDYSVRVQYNGQDEIGHLVESFNVLVKALAGHEQSQQRWIADISHELRTPLAILKGELEALQDGVRPLTVSSLDSLRDELLRLQRLVDDLHQLTLSDVGALRYRFELINIVDVVTDIFKQHESQLNDHQMSFSMHAVRDSIDILADVDRLYQLLRNLLQNSLRYSDDCGNIRVDIQCQHNDLLLVWEDSAPGVSSNALDRLFDRLYREEASRNRQQGGSGLGLSICHAIVQAHNGNISAEHSSLGGLKIIIQLPLKKR